MVNGRLCCCEALCCTKFFDCWRIILHVQLCHNRTFDINNVCVPTGALTSRTTCTYKCFFRFSGKTHFHFNIRCMFYVLKYGGLWNVKCEMWILQSSRNVDTNHVLLSVSKLIIWQIYY